MENIRAERPENIVDVGEKRLIAQNENIVVQIGKIKEKCLKIKDETEGSQNQKWNIIFGKDFFDERIIFFHKEYFLKKI
jgi:hypothetical protein